MSEIPKKYDIWRDSPLRFMGYCNEVGEAFAPLYRRLLLPSYALSVGYVIGDTIDKTYAEYKLQQTSKIMEYKKIATEAGDVLCWQMLASVIAPGLTIKAVATASNKLFRSAVATANLSPTICRFSPTALGLAAIPFIIKPIDRAVDELLDATYRKHFGKYIEVPYDVTTTNTD